MSSKPFYRWQYPHKNSKGQSIKFNIDLYRFLNMHASVCGGFFFLFRDICILLWTFFLGISNSWMCHYFQFNADLAFVNSCLRLFLFCIGSFKCRSWHPVAQGITSINGQALPTTRLLHCCCRITLVVLNITIVLKLNLRSQYYLG